MREQNLFQGVVTAAFLILAPYLARLFSGLDVSLLRITMLAVFFQLLFLTEMTFLFYFELYLPSFLAALAYFTVNLAGALATALSGTGFYGLSYLGAGIAGSLICALFLFRAVDKADRLILARYTT